MTDKPEGDRAQRVPSQHVDWEPGAGGRVSYDREADAIGIYFAPEGAEYEVSSEVAPGVVLDYDKQGRVIGVELLHVRKLLEQEPSAVTADT
ncbi:DUF2283 domain-containing protein [Rhodopila sp.]|uniref:DUF2283 domain-containing protein n=1 Tax=Rhodopila sp. TaxID=2480087 RepID=UPI003D0C00FC